MRGNEIQYWLLKFQMSECDRIEFFFSLYFVAGHVRHICLYKQFGNSFYDGQGLPQHCAVSTFESALLSVRAIHSEHCVLPTKRVCVLHVMLWMCWITQLNFVMEMHNVLLKYYIFWMKFWFRAQLYMSLRYIWRVSSTRLQFGASAAA